MHFCAEKQKQDPTDFRYQSKRERKPYNTKSSPQYGVGGEIVYVLNIFSLTLFNRYSIFKRYSSTMTYYFKPPSEHVVLQSYTPRPALLG